MTNVEIKNKLMDEFGKDSTMLFCQMYSIVNKYLYEYYKEHLPDEFNDFDFEMAWWRSEYLKMKEEK